MKVFEDGVRPNQLTEKSEGTIGTINTLTIAARAGHFTVLDSLVFSGDDDLAVGTKITISFGGVAKWVHFIKYASPGPIDLDKLHTGIKNEVVTIVADASAGRKINLTVNYR
jgi:hypothetical protein